MIIAIAPYIIMVRSYMESEPIVAMSNEKPIRITTAIASYASLYMRDDLIIIYRYVKIIRITNAYVNIKCSLYHRLSLLNTTLIFSAFMDSISKILLVQVFSISIYVSSTANIMEAACTPLNVFIAPV